MPHGMLELINMTNICANVWVIYCLSNVMNMHANVGAPHNMFHMTNLINTLDNVGASRGMFDMINLTKTLPNAKAPHGLFDLINFGSHATALII
jgi:hypothetical protein